MDSLRGTGSLKVPGSNGVGNWELGKGLDFITRGNDKGQVGD